MKYKLQFIGMTRMNLHEQITNDSLNKHFLSDKAGHAAALIFTRGTVIFRIWCSSSLVACGTMRHIDLQQKRFTLDPSMFSGSIEIAGLSADISVPSAHGQTDVTVVFQVFQQFKHFSN